MSTDQRISLDTNILIDNPEVVFQKDKTFVVSFKVVQELDNLKRNPDLKFAAQTALRNLRAQILEDKIEVLNMPDALGDSPDEIIINDTKNADAALLTGDLGAQLIAKAFGVALADFESEDAYDKSYVGYVTIQGDLNYEQDFVQVKELPLAEFELKFDVTLKENQYCIIDRVIDKDDIWVNQRGVVTRISQSMQPIRAAGIVESPLDSVQMCVLHSVMNSDVPLTIIDGKLGSGKTILSIIGALATTRGQKKWRMYDKIYVTRPPVTISKSLQLGYLKGGLEEKFTPWLSGIKSNLQFLLEKTDVDKEREVAEEVFEETFELVSMESIQGLSLHNGILLVDEYQLLSVDELKLVLSRIAKGSKVILIGDTEGQTYSINRANEGFKVLFKHLGNAPELSYIKMEKIYRSALAEFIEKIFN
jgi:PhoH-like ATPase